MPARTVQEVLEGLDGVRRRSLGMDFSYFELGVMDWVRQNQNFTQSWSIARFRLLADKPALIVTAHCYGEDLHAFTVTRDAVWFNPRECER